MPSDKVYYSRTRISKVTLPQSRKDVVALHIKDTLSGNGLKFNLDAMLDRDKITALINTWSYHQLARCRGLQQLKAFEIPVGTDINLCNVNEVDDQDVTYEYTIGE